MSLRPLCRVVMACRPHLPVLIVAIVATVSFFVLYCWLSPDRYEAAPWLPHVVVTLLGLVGASWFVNRRLDLFNEQLAATERGNLNDAIKEAVSMMSKHSPSSIIAGQRWLHHLAEDDRLDADLIRSLLCAQIASSDPASTSHGADTDGIQISDETRRRTRQMALEMLFGSPGKDRYSQCQDKPELGSCTWRDSDFTDLHVENVNFRKGNFINTQISGTHFDGCDLRETEWSGVVGGSARTSMRSVKMCGASASSCTFDNINFSGANMGNNGLATRFHHCIFKYCNFEGASWSGVDFSTADFKDGCAGINFDLCRDAIVKGAAGLPNDLVEELRSKGVGGY